MRIAERQLYAGETLTAYMRQQLDRRILARQHVQLQLPSAPRRRGQGKRRPLAIGALQQQVLPGVVTRLLASRQT